MFVATQALTAIKAFEALCCCQATLQKVCLLFLQICCANTIDLAYEIRQVIIACSRGVCSTSGGCTGHTFCTHKFAGSHQQRKHATSFCLLCNFGLGSCSQQDRLISNIATWQHHTLQHDTMILVISPKAAKRQLVLRDVAQHASKPYAILYM